MAGEAALVEMALVSVNMVPFSEYPLDKQKKSVRNKQYHLHHTASTQYMYHSFSLKSIHGYSGAGDTNVLFRKA